MGNRPPAGSLPESATTQTATKRRLAIEQRLTYLVGEIREAADKPFGPIRADGTRATAAHQNAVDNHARLVAERDRLLAELGR